MISQRRFLVSTLLLISLTGTGFCQFQSDSSDELPGEDAFTPLPDLPDNFELSPSITDQKAKTSLTFDQSTLPPLTSKAEATSEPLVVATTQSTPEPSENPSLEEVDFPYPYDPTSGPACVRLCLAAYFEVPYLSSEYGGQVEKKIAKIPITKKAHVGGKCGNGKKGEPTRIILQWGGDKYQLKIAMEKTRNGDTDNWEAALIQFSYDTRDLTYFENAVEAGEKVVFSNPDETFFESPWKKSFVCRSESVVNMTSKDKTATSYLRIEKLQLQPFMKESANGTWGEEEQCENDKIIKPTSNVASVAVGATLGCLILIVILVYAVGRKMGSITDRTGYKSVE